MLGPYKFSLLATVHHYGNSVQCGCYTANPVNCYKDYSIAIILDLLYAILVTHVPQQYILLYNLLMECFDQTMEVGS